MNAYLTNLRTKYDGIRSTIEGLQTRAADEGRDLTEDELRSIQEQGTDAAKLAQEIESLTDIETRNRKVAELAAGLAEEKNTEQVRSALPVGSAQTKDRDPGHYRKGGAHSFFGDVYQARTHQDGDALRRLTEHNRALDSAGEGVGVVAPVWLTSEFQESVHQSRRVASAVRNLPLSSPAPMSMPKQTGSAAVAEQSAENSALGYTDAWDSDIDTVTPKAIGGGQIVSRQLLDSGNPAVDALIYSDLLADYNGKVEAKVVAAMIASAGTAVRTYATEAAWDTAAGNLQVSDDIVDVATAVRVARKLPADVLITSVGRYAELLKLKDSTGRPLLPADSAGPMNVIGSGTVAVDGRIHGLGVLASDGVTQYPESILAARASDTILFESPVMRFSYEQPNGPESIKIGVWAYTAVYVKYAGLSVKRNVITAATA